MNTKVLLLGVAIAIGSLTRPTETEAGTFGETWVYVCQVSYYPVSVSGAPSFGYPTNGSYGRLSVSFYTQPFCAGNFARQASIFSTGSNVLDITDEDLYAPYGESELFAAQQALLGAAEGGARVAITGVTFQGGFSFGLPPTNSQLHTYSIRPN